MRNKVGERLLHIRAGRPQSEAAAALGVSLRSYAYYERGERIPDGEALERLASEGWNINWLLTGTGPERLEALSGTVSGGSQEMRLDLETLREAIEVTDIVLEMQGIAPDRADRARLYSLVYDYLRDDATAATSGQAMAGVLRLIQGGRR